MVGKTAIQVGLADLCAPSQVIARHGTMQTFMLSRQTIPGRMGGRPSTEAPLNGMLAGVIDQRMIYACA